MSIYNINGNEIFSAYDINGTALAEAFDIAGNIVWSAGPHFRPSATINNIYTSALTIQPQGGCIDDNENAYVCFYHAGKFLKYNIGTAETYEVSFTGDAYGHANGMAYNPNTGHLYLAAMKATGEVYVFDTSFNLVDTLYAKNADGNVFNCWNIAYDRINEQFITLIGNTDGGTIRFYNNNLEYISEVNYTIPGYTFTAQDIETDGEFIYYIAYNPNYIFVFDMTGAFIAAINNSAFGGEPESMMYDWINNVYYIEGKDSTFVIRQAIFKD